MANFNASLLIASTHAPQIGTLGENTTPTTTQGTAIWNLAAGVVKMCLRSVGASDDPTDYTASSAGLLWCQEVEALLTSGRLLEAKGSIGVRAQGSRAAGSGDTTAKRLIDAANKMLADLKKDRNLKAVIIEDGAANNLPASDFASSDWTDGKNPDFVEVFGPTGDQPYVPPPVLYDRELL